MAWRRGLVVLAAGVVFGRYVLPETLPFVSALVLAAALAPWTRRLVGLGLPPRRAGLVVLLVLAAALSLLLLLVALALRHEVGGAAGRLPVVAHEVQQGLARLLGRGHALGVSAATVQEVLRPLSGAVAGWAHGAAGAFSHLPEVLLSCLMAGVALFFLVRDGAEMGEKAIGLLPEAYRGPAAEQLGTLWRAVAGFFRAELTLMATTAGLVAAGLAALGEPFPLLLGAAAGVLDLVPGLGASAVLVPWALFLLVGGRPAAGLRLLALLAAVVAVREVVESRVVGGAVGLHPLAALVAMYLGLKVFGPLGVAFGPILLAAGWAAARAA